MSTSRTSKAAKKNAAKVEQQVGIGEDVMMHLLATLEQLSYDQMRQVSGAMLRIYKTKDFSKEREAHQQKQQEVKELHKAEVEKRKQERKVQKQWAVRKRNGELTQKRFPTIEAAKDWVKTWAGNGFSTYQYVNVLSA